MPDFPAADGCRKSARKVLSETEEKEEVPAGPGLQDGDPLAVAVTKLTEIATHLTLEKKKSRTFGVNPRRSWFSRSFRYCRDYQLQATSSSPSSFEVGVVETARSHIKSHREEYGRRFQQGQADARHVNGYRDSSSVARTQVTGSGVSDSSQIPLVRRRRSRRAPCRQSSRSKGLVVGSSWRWAINCR